MKKIVFVVLFLVSLVFTGCFNNTKDEVTEPTTEKTTQPVQKNNAQDIATAQQVLIQFFQYLHEEKYEDAVALFDPQDGLPDSWEAFEQYSPNTEKSDKAGLLKAYCNLVETCLPIQVKSSGDIGTDIYQFTVQFIQDNGGVYVQGPCCGETEENMPSSDSFAYNVKKIDGTFKVTTSPLYQP